MDDAWMICITETFVCAGTGSSSSGKRILQPCLGGYGDYASIDDSPIRATARIRRNNFQQEEHGAAKYDLTYYPLELCDEDDQNEI